MDEFLDLNYIGRAEKRLENEITTMSDFIFRSERKKKQKTMGHFFGNSISLFHCDWIVCMMQSMFYALLCSVFFVFRSVIIYPTCDLYEGLDAKKKKKAQKKNWTKFVMCCCHLFIFVNLMRPMPLFVN